MGRNKITRVEEEARRETMQRGLKHGSIQNGIDKILDKFGDGASDKTVDMLKKVHDSADVTAPAVDTFVKSAMLFGFAEVVNATSLLGTKIPGLSKIDEGKYEQMAAYLRGYAGQRAGTQTADGMFKAAPVFMEMITNPTLKELLDEGTGPTVPQLAESSTNATPVDSGGGIAKLSEDDDD